MTFNINDLRDTVDHLLSSTEPIAPNSLAILRGMITREMHTSQKTLKSVLLGPIQSQYKTLMELGEAWLSTGAQGYVLVDSQVLFCWPESMQAEIEQVLSSITLWSALRIEGRKVGKAGVFNLHGEAFQARLEAETLLLSLLLSLKINIDMARAELHTQQRLESDMAMVANIQLQLLQQKIPEVPGLRLVARSMPALYPAGDFYNFNLQKQGLLVFVVGDVSGKGLPAAMLMVMMRIVLHGAARFMPEVSPRLLLSRVNEDLYEDFINLGMFATAFVGCYDPIIRRLTYANAGHSPVLLCPHGGSAVLLQADGPAVGVLPLNLCANICIDFLPGDVLMVATDGLSEASNRQGELFGYERLLQLLEQLAPLSADEIVEGMIQAVLQFSDGAEQSDDQTLVLFKGMEV